MYFEAYHRVFHTVSSFHALGNRIRIGDGELGIRADGVRHCFGREFPVKAVGFLAIKTHGHHFFTFNEYRHGVPHKLPAAGPGKVPHIIRLKDPGFAGCAFLYMLFKTSIDENKNNE